MSGSWAARAIWRASVAPPPFKAFHDHSTLNPLAFGKTDLKHMLAKMCDALLNRHAFGAVVVGAAGRFLKYKAAEAAITGCDPTIVVNRM